MFFSVERFDTVSKSHKLNKKKKKKNLAQAIYRANVANTNCILILCSVFLLFTIILVENKIISTKLEFGFCFFDFSKLCFKIQKI